MKDRYDREINYMRISVTDRCNLRCRYCMPHGIEKVSMSRILSYEQIAEIAKAAVSLGIDRFKITGGEPLVRKGCVGLIKMIRGIGGVKSVTLTTNGVLLSEYAGSLAEAGIDGVNISLDTLDRKRYEEITGFDLLNRALEGIGCSLSSGFRTKVNAVLQRGVNEDEWEDLLLLAKDRPVDVRFIELMPIGDAAASESVSNEALLERILEKYPDAAPDTKIHGNGPAEYLHIPGFSGSVGFISAMHGKFCGSCNRIRLTSTGLIKTCLCYSGTADLTGALIEADPAKRSALLKQAIAAAIENKQKEHHFERTGEITERRKMSEIGG